MISPSAVLALAGETTLPSDRRLWVDVLRPMADVCGLCHLAMSDCAEELASAHDVRAAGVSGAAYMLADVCDLLIAMIDTLSSNGGELPS